MPQIDCKNLKKIPRHQTWPVPISDVVEGVFFLPNATLTDCELIRASAINQVAFVDEAAIGTACPTQLATWLDIPKTDLDLNNLSAVVFIDTHNKVRPSSPMPENLRNSPIPLFAARIPEAEFFVRNSTFEIISAGNLSVFMSDLPPNSKECFSCSYDGGICDGFNAMTDEGCAETEILFRAFKAYLKKVKMKARNDLCTNLPLNNYCTVMSEKWRNVAKIMNQLRDKFTLIPINAFKVNSIRK